MKKSHFILITVLTAISAFAQYTPLDQLSYTTNNNEIVITGGDASITDLRIPPTINTLPVTTIGTGAFGFNRGNSITNIILPNTLQTISNSAFFGCSSLASITLPNSLKTIGEHAFYICRSLPSITLPSSLESVGHYAFVYCDALSQLTVATNNLYYQSINNVLFNKDATELVHHPAGLNATTYTVPDDVVTISPGAFNNGNSLTQIFLSTSLQTLGDYAFSNCSSLESITLPENLQSIGDYAFSKCTSLTTATLPSNLRTIDDYAFYQCVNLTHVFFRGNPPENIESDIFKGVASSATIYIQPETSGFTNPFAGLPVVVIMPLTIDSIIYESGYLMVTPSHGTDNVIVKEADELDAGIWTPITSPVINNDTFQFPTHQHQHFYRFYRFSN